MNTVLLFLAQAGGAGAGGKGFSVDEWGWRPFIDPIDPHGSLWWGWIFLLIPLALGISIIYKAVKQPALSNGKEMGEYAKKVAAMTAQIVVAMVLLGAAMYVFIEVYVGWIAGRG